MADEHKMRHLGRGEKLENGRHSCSAGYSGEMERMGNEAAGSRTRAAILDVSAVLVYLALKPVGVC
jgi:hypothetical protein